jgi:hypothetical protein
MRLRARLGCVLFGHRPVGGRATYDASAGSFVDVAKTQYAVCGRCGAVRPAPLSVVGGEGGERGERDGEDQGKEVVGDEEAEPPVEERDGVGGADEGDETPTATETERDGADGGERRVRAADGERSPSVTGTR